MPQRKKINLENCCLNRRVRPEFLRKLANIEKEKGNTFQDKEDLLNFLKNV